MKKLILLLVLLTLALLFFALGGHEWLTLEALKRHQAEFAALRGQAPWLTAAGFFLLYVLVAALSLPGAAIMTLAAGALFGLWQGLVLVSFASSLGATLAMLVARFLLRDQVQQRFGDRLKAVNDGIARDGAFYLFTLRLVPVFPFFLINLLMGLTPFPARRFYWVSQLGMLPGTLVYVNAGTQLAALDSLGGILSPALWLSFALLGIFPLLARSLVRLIQRRRVYKGWQKTRQFDRNLIVIGAGAAGLVSAYIAATVRARVTLIEAGKMGGDCLNTGCVPSKALIRSARLAHQMRHADRYGLCATQPEFSFKRVMARVQEIIKKVAPHDSVERYTALGVEVLQGHGRLLDPWTVEVSLNDGGRRRLSARSVIIAAGAEPLVPELPGLEEVGYLTSDTLWQALAERDSPPRRLLVLGGGPIGCELAQALARLGSEVTLMQRNPRLMPKEDQEVSDLVKESLTQDGIAVLTGHQPLRLEQDDQGKRLIARHHDREVALPFDDLLIALGRRPRLTGYGLEQLGIDTERKLETNDYLETLYPNIYAAGDVAGGYQFTHTAAHMAWYASVNALFGQFKRFKVDYSVIPWCTFVDPEVARVGLSEAEARDRGIACEVTRFGLDDLDRAIADGADHGFIKVLTVPGKDRILGVTIVGEHAGELLAEYVLAMRHHLGLNKLLATIHIYPTLSEANKYAAGEWKKAHAPQRLLAWLARYHGWRRGGKQPQGPL
ncbi:pyridine nucleotide-disulfide oxidoreductase [Zobellella denitrificans]|uniref:Pyridine nucleotide-disulfide oxidoreductase n=1 Tax=Zobellella denitrificans TaxID=347534 RepID=A0A291HNV4_9GAMM|nr:bifunctional TVP38/TMEM64 family protein/FAD-dependent oxidoreductase [Zobellella denitrificans]ATG73751.1 pyridine nucleotide-disulfide oxidoreductase [Zobellella denitrificans]